LLREQEDELGALKAKVDTMAEEGVVGNGGGAGGGALTSVSENGGAPMHSPRVRTSMPARQLTGPLVDPAGEDARTHQAATHPNSSGIVSPRTSYNKSHGLSAVHERDDVGDDDALLTPHSPSSVGGQARRLSSEQRRLHSSSSQGSDEKEGRRSHREDPREGRRSSHREEPDMQANMGEVHAAAAKAAAATAALEIVKGEVHMQMKKSEGKMAALEDKMVNMVTKLDDRLRDAEAHRRVTAGKATKQEEGVHSLLANLQEQDRQIQEFRKKLDAMDKVKANSEAVLGMQTEVTDLKDKMGQAALASVIEPKVDGLIVKLERVIKSCSRTDEQLESTTLQCRDIGSDVSNRFSKLADMAPRKEMDRRCEGMEQQMRGLSQLLMEVESSLGDLSTAILALGTKAEHADLNVLREELCQISEHVKDREQAVLFGARCLSCNRVFDDVSKDTNIVDLSGEKQRNALFTQVQRALHSPKIDPLAKIKVLAVKIGRPLTVPGSGGMGVFEGRDATSLACGVDDVHLVPMRQSARDFAPSKTELMEILPRQGGPPTNHIKQGRRLKGAPQRESTSDALPRAIAKRQEGPMDFKHPLSALVDRCQFRPLTTL